MLEAMLSLFFLQGLVLGKSLSNLCFCRLSCGFTLNYFPVSFRRHVCPIFRQPTPLPSPTSPVVSVAIQKYLCATSGVCAASDSRHIRPSVTMAQSTPKKSRSSRITVPMSRIWIAVHISNLMRKILCPCSCHRVFGYTCVSFSRLRQFFFLRTSPPSNPSSYQYRNPLPNQCLSAFVIGMSRTLLWIDSPPDFHCRLTGCHVKNNLFPATHMLTFFCHKSCFTFDLLFLVFVSSGHLTHSDTAAISPHPVDVPPLYLGFDLHILLLPVRGVCVLPSPRCHDKHWLSPKGGEHCSLG